MEQFQPILPHATPGRLQRRSVSRRIHGGSFSSNACSAPSHVRPISILVPWIVLWPKDVAAVGARGVGVGTARKHAKKAQHARRRQCHANPPPSTHSHAHVPKKHAQIHLRRVWPNAHGAVLFPPCTPEHYARQLHGSGHTRPLASVKNIQETNTRLHVQARQIGAGSMGRACP